MPAPSSEPSRTWAGRAIRAVMERDGSLLATLGEEHPTRTLYFLDYLMRGLLFGIAPFVFEQVVDESPPLREWLAWVIEQDRALRRRVGLAQQAADLSTLRAAYRGGDLALVVGAGASMAAHMPGWNELVIEMIDRALYEGSDAHREELTRNFASRAKGGETIGHIGGKAYITDEAAFAKLLQEELQPASPAARACLERAKAELSGGDPSRRSNALRDAGEAVYEVFGDRFDEELRIQLFERTLYRTKLHPAIARMVRPRQGAGPTPRVHTIVTYNFDDLLETAIRESGQEATTIVSKGGQEGGLRAGRPIGHPERPSAVDIIHPHGFLPATRGAFFAVPLRDVDLVFSDSQYRARYGEDESWTKRVQVAFFGNSPCLFLGSSLEDEDATAQLRQVQRKHPGWLSYAIMQLPREGRDRREQLDGAELERLGAAHRALGLRTIWIADHDEIPGLLDSISDPDQQDEVASMRLPPIPLPVVHALSDPDASDSLGVLLARNGDTEGARRAFERAIDTPGYAGAAQSTRHLGLLLQQIGDATGAISVFTRAAQSGDPDIGPLAANNLGGLLHELGQFVPATAAYQFAIDSKHPREAPIGHLNLGITLAAIGERERAKREIQVAIDSPTIEEGPLAVARRVMEELG